MKKNDWEKDFDIKFTDHNFVISKNKPIVVGAVKVKEFIRQLLDNQREELLKRLPSVKKMTRETIFYSKEKTIRFIRNFIKKKLGGGK